MFWEAGFLFGGMLFSIMAFGNAIVCAGDNREIRSPLFVELCAAACWTGFYCSLSWSLMR